MDSVSLKLKKATPHCGAEVLDLDLSQSLGDDLVRMLEQALAEHGVLFFRNQKLDPTQQKTIGTSFGKLHIHPEWPQLVEGHPEIMELLTDENSTYIAGENWHSDVSCDIKPPLGTVFYTLEVPPVGGDTLFANTCAAFESLSLPMQKFLSGLTAIHDGEHHYRGRYIGDRAEYKDYPKATHPVVRTHPISGQNSLFVNRIFTTRIIELEEPESAEILGMLFNHIEQPEFQCRIQWEPESLAIWDNRCVQHKALWDYFPNRRHALRVTIEGEKPFFDSMAKSCPAPLD